MNVLLVPITVMIMRNASTQLEASPVPVTMGTVGMALTVQVRSCSCAIIILILFICPLFYPVNFPSAPTDFQSTALGSTFVMLTWTQAQEVVDSYYIQYSFCTNHCPLVGGQDIVILAGGTLREFNLTGLQEDSVYEIQIMARNAAGDNSSDVINITTSTAGKQVAEKDVSYITSALL